MTNLINKMALGLACLSAIVSPSVANAAGDRSFTTVNYDYNYSIQQVWFAAAGESDAWQTADMDSPVAPRSSTTFTFSSGSRCFFDVKIRTSDGNDHYYSNINACRGDHTATY